VHSRDSVVELLVVELLFGPAWDLFCDSESGGEGKGMEKKRCFLIGYYAQRN